MMENGSPEQDNKVPEDISQEQSELPRSEHPTVNELFDKTKDFTPDNLTDEQLQTIAFERGKQVSELTLSERIVGSDALAVQTFLEAYRKNPELITGVLEFVNNHEDISYEMKIGQIVGQALQEAAQSKTKNSVEAMGGVNLSESAFAPYTTELAGFSDLSQADEPPKQSSETSQKIEDDNTDEKRDGFKGWGAYSKEERAKILGRVRTKPTRPEGPRALSQQTEADVNTTEESNDHEKIDASLAALRAFHEKQTTDAERIARGEEGVVPATDASDTSEQETTAPFLNTEEKSEEATSTDQPRTYVDYMNEMFRPEGTPVSEEAKAQLSIQTEKLESRFDRLKSKGRTALLAAAGLGAAVGVIPADSVMAPGYAKPIQVHEQEQQEGLEKPVSEGPVVLSATEAPSVTQESAAPGAETIPTKVTLSEGGSYSGELARVMGVDPLTFNEEVFSELPARDIGKLVEENIDAIIQSQKQMKGIELTPDQIKQTVEQANDPNNPNSTQDVEQLKTWMNEFVPGVELNLLTPDQLKAMNGEVYNAEGALYTIASPEPSIPETLLPDAPSEETKSEEKFERKSGSFLSRWFGGGK